MAGINLNVEHGIPTYVENHEKLWGYTGYVIPMYSPGIGLRDTKYMIYLLDDWKRLGEWLKGDASYPHFQPGDIEQDYKLLTTPEDILESLVVDDDDQAYNYQYLPIDTETDEGKPFSLQFSPRPGIARMFLIKPELVEAFRHGLEENYFNKVLVHNADHDLEDLWRLGIDIKENDCNDTMRELYHLANQPQGLKAAVCRTIGHRMTSYDETVSPHSNRVMRDWLEQAINHVEQSWYKIKYVQLKTKVREERKPHEALAVLRRIYRKITEEGSEYDPWQEPKFQKNEMKPRLFGREWLLDLEREVYRMPRKSIVHVPIDEAVIYGCSDADYTGRLSLWLASERKRIVQQEWRVA